MLSYPSISPLIDISKPYLMNYDLEYLKTSPIAGNALKIPFLKRLLSYKADEMDNKASISGRDRDTSGVQTQYVKTVD
jgi:hypothetical protein